MILFLHCIVATLTWFVPLFTAIMKGFWPPAAAAAAGDIKGLLKLPELIIKIGLVVVVVDTPPLISEAKDLGTAMMVEPPLPPPELVPLPVDTPLNTVATSELMRVRLVVNDTDGAEAAPAVEAFRISFRITPPSPPADPSLLPPPPPPTPKPLFPTTSPPTTEHPLTSCWPPDVAVTVEPALRSSDNEACVNTTNDVVAADVPATCEAQDCGARIRDGLPVMAFRALLFLSSTTAS